MEKKNYQRPRGGCFAWLFRVKKSVNERLARVRNSLRKKLARENRLTKPLTPGDIENDTGSPDLIITRILASPRSLPSTGEIPSAVVTDEVPGVCDFEETQGILVEKNGYIGCNLDGDPDPQQVKEFVMKIITSAKEELDIRQDIRLEAPMTKEDTSSMTSSMISMMANEAVKHSLTSIVHDRAEESNVAVIDDNESMSSGAISDMAEAAVTESLTKIINDHDSIYTENTEE